MSSFTTNVNVHGTPIQAKLKHEWQSGATPPTKERHPRPAYDFIGLDCYLIYRHKMVLHLCLNQVQQNSVTLSSERRHLFISHHHKDDALVDSFVKMLGHKGWDVRNSSIRAKPANQQRLDKGMVKEEAIRRLLRMKISWAKTVVVLVGSDTHSRPWVNWEIEQAHKQGKRIVGVYERGGTDADLPTNLEKHACAIVAWNSSSIQRAINSEENVFQDVGGAERPAVGQRRTSC